MPLISRFDPWRSNICTCPPKLTLNPYTGCDYGCVYCYASSYIPHFSNCRPKRGVLHCLQREASKLRGEIVSIANSSDPYPQMEANKILTRKCLEILSHYDCRIQIITKSALVARDIDILSRKSCIVAITITTENENIAKSIEPYAPSPNKRLKTIEKLISKNIPVSVRLDPIIPLVNDNPANLISTLADMGVKHLTTSTYKAKPDSWRRLCTAIPKVTEKLKALYFEKGEKKAGYTLMPKVLRLRLLKKIRQLSIENGMKFGGCREDLSELNTATCDGSWLMPASKR